MVLGTTQTRHHLITKTVQVRKSIDDVLQAADRAEPKLRRELIAALEGLRVPGLADMIAAGAIAAATEAIASTVISPATYLAVTEAALNATIAAAMPEAAKFKIAFNEPNRRAIKWAEQNIAVNIVGVPPASAQAINDALVESLRRGIHPRVTAAHIDHLMGLQPNHVKAVNRLYFSSLQDGVTVEHARKIADRKAAKLIRYRAESIARTESINAANMGQQLVWETALDLGLLPEGTRKIWVATFDDRLCKICAVLDGTTIEIRESFAVNYEATGFKVTGDKITVTGVKPMKNPSMTKQPTAHIQCRCTSILEPL